MTYSTVLNAAGVCHEPAAVLVMGSVLTLNSYSLPFVSVGVDWKFVWAWLAETICCAVANLQMRVEELEQRVAEIEEAAGHVKRRRIG